MSKLLKTVLSGTVLVAAWIPVSAHAQDVSPTLLIQSQPSDQAGYRRMVYVRYLDGSRIRASYKAYNRREFSRADGKVDPNVISKCAQGNSTSLSEIRSFAKAEFKRKQKGQTPEVRAFCIKNVPNWEAKNKDLYLDPIFETMPYVKGQG